MTPIITLLVRMLCAIALHVPVGIWFQPWSVYAGQATDFIQKRDFQGRPALVLSNDVLELTVLSHGGAFARLLLKSDPQKVNPLWDSIRAAREAGRSMWAHGYVGHFVCVDGFGPASADEKQAGLSGHGEAHNLPWTTESSTRRDGIVELTQSVHLPRTHEVLRRRLTIAEGERIVYVRSTLENLLSFDRPVHWTEHATIGSPFLEPGVTVVDLSGNRALTRRDQQTIDDLPHRLPPGKRFAWPIAPGIDREIVDMRATPQFPNSIDHTGHLFDRNQPLAFATALNPRQRLLLGYVFKPAQFSWLQNWEYYPPRGVLARGLEFGTQPFGRPRREVVTRNKLFDTLLYRWLPARSTIETSFLLFWTRTPAGFQGVDDVQLQDDSLHIRDNRSGQTLNLEASQPL